LPILAIQFFNAVCVLEFYLLFISLSQATKLYYIKVNHLLPNPLQVFNFQLTKALMQLSLGAGDMAQSKDLATNITTSI
jgi:hypothetical protein